MDFISLLYGVEERKFVATECREEFVEIANNWQEIMTKLLNGDIEEIKRKYNKETIIKYLSSDFSTICTDNLEKYLEEEKDDTYYYIGVNQFVLDYYKNNPNSEWKIKAILQLGFPYDFLPGDKEHPVLNYNFVVWSFLENKKWSLFVFTKRDFSNVVLGFDDNNTFAHLESIKNKRDIQFNSRKEELSEKAPGSICFVFNPDDEMRDNLIVDYLVNDKVRVLSKDEKRKSGYSFNEVPVEKFKLEYLDYLSRYKESVVEIFGYPEKGEKITKLKNVVKFINSPGQETVYPDDRRANVLLKDLFFHDGKLKPTVRIGEQNIDYYTFFEEYEFYSYDVSPYYLYCLLSSEFIIDYFSDRYSEDKYYDSSTPLPFDDCPFIDLPSKNINLNLYKEKYELDINPRLKVHNILENKDFANQNAKEAVNKFLVEINDAIKNGLYYSATIVIGSVLEAFLIDWLSEIDGKDYFKEPYLLPEKNNKRADLKDYIDIIQKKRPDWIDGAKKATFIRTKRNTVHAKLYIEEKEISEKTCMELLNDLNAIIHNRWKD